MICFGAPSAAGSAFPCPPLIRAAMSPREPRLQQALPLVDEAEGFPASSRSCAPEGVTLPFWARSDMPRRIRRTCSARRPAPLQVVAAAIWKVVSARLPGLASKWSQPRSGSRWSLLLRLARMVSAVARSHVPQKTSSQTAFLEHSGPGICGQIDPRWETARGRTHAVRLQHPDESTLQPRTHARCPITTSRRRAPFISYSACALYASFRENPDRQYHHVALDFLEI